MKTETMMITSVSLLKNGTHYRVRVFADGDFRHQVRASTEGFFDFTDGTSPWAAVEHAVAGSCTPVDFTVDTPTGYPSGATFLLVLTPVIEGEPQDGEEDGRGDHRCAVHLT